MLSGCSQRAYERSITCRCRRPSELTHKPKLSAIAVRVPGKGLGRASVGPNNSDVLQAENVTPLADALDTA